MNATNEKEKRAPGVMLYFSSRPSFELLEPEDVKTLLLAMLDYGRTGVEPNLTRPMQRLAWAGLREKLDWDLQRYERVCLSNKYKRFLREADRHFPREQCPDYEKWLELSDGGRLSASEVLLILGAS